MNDVKTGEKLNSSIAVKFIKYQFLKYLKKKGFNKQESHHFEQFKLFHKKNL